MHQEREGGKAVIESAILAILVLIPGIDTIIWRGMFIVDMIIERI